MTHKMNANFSRLREIIEAASELPPDERRDAALQMCGNDAALHEEVDQLLQQMVDDDFLTPQIQSGFAPPRSTVSAADYLSVYLNRSVGGFHVVRVIGEGGMGIVFEAEQAEPRRRVALKILRERRDSVSIRRFRDEAEILAKLQHPGIALVLAAGVDDQPDAIDPSAPWMAMELLEGAVSVTSYVAAKNLSIREIVQLVIRISDALAHAHQKGVIHRDLKPANILVTPEGQPKIIDFGIARLDRSSQDPDYIGTQAGEMYGTIPYMSPEQIRGERDRIDTRTDVYGLGVVLYQLLSGRLPFNITGKSVPEAARMICEARPAPLSKSEKKLPADLETIVLKSIDQDPERRYSGARELGRDLERFLNAEAVEARPPGFWYLTRTFARRNRILVGGVAAVLAVAIAGTVVSTIYARKAGTSNQQARLLFSTLLDRSVEETFEFANRVYRLQGGADVAAAMLESTLSDLNELQHISSGDAAVQVQFVKAKIRLGDVLGNPAFPNLGDSAGALKCYQSALELARVTASTHPQLAQAREALGLALRRCGVIESHEKRFENAIKYLSESLEIFRTLCAANPEHRAFQAELGHAHNALAEYYGLKGETEPFEASVREYRNVFSQLAQIEPRNASVQTQHAYSIQRTATVYWRKKEYLKARDEYLQAVQILDALLAQDSDDTVLRRERASSRMWAASALLLTNSASTAENELQIAAAEFEELYRTDPRNRSIHRTLLNTYFMLGNAARTLQHNSRASEYYQKGLAFRDALGADRMLTNDLAGYGKAIEQARDQLAKPVAKPKAQ
ncbi:MAG: protein kinase domain-containing protein [Planctomycetota bacterium]